MEDKTYEQLQQEMYTQLQQSEYINEVAMPGIRRPVNPDDAEH